MSKLFSPIGSRIIIRRENPRYTESGIALPEKTKQPNIGEVVAVHGGIINNNGKVIQSEINVGDRVYFPPRLSYPVTIFDERLLWINEEDIVGIVED